MGQKDLWQPAGQPGEEGFNLGIMQKEDNNPQPGEKAVDLADKQPFLCASKQVMSHEIYDNSFCQ